MSNETPYESPASKFDRGLPFSQNVPRMKTISLVSLFSASVFISSCAPPSAIDSQGRPIAAGASNSLRSQGSQIFQKYKQEKSINRDSRYNAPVQRVAARLKRVIPLANADWEFVVFNDKTPNAFALPGGKVGIHTGLFQITQNDAGLAAVLAHEITHVTANHAGVRQQQQRGIALGGALLGAVLGEGASTNAATSLYNTGTKLAVALPHSRKQELEADRIGMIYMARAGYNPEEAVNFWKRFAAYNQRQGSQTPEFLRTHPIDQTRINALKASLPAARAAYTQ